MILGKGPSLGTANTKRSRPASGEKIPTVATPEPVHKKINTSVVSSDDSFVEINAQDFKHFQADHIYDMYVNLGHKGQANPAVIDDTSKKGKKKSSSSEKTNDDEVFKKSVRGRSRKKRSDEFTNDYQPWNDANEEFHEAQPYENYEIPSNQARPRNRSRSNSRKPETELENIYEVMERPKVTKDRFPAGDMDDRTKGDFHVSFQDKEFEHYHTSLRDPIVQSSTPLREEKSGAVNNGYSFDHGYHSQIYPVTRQEDFEIVHHMQCSPIGQQYPNPSHQIYSEKPRVHTYNISNNKSPALNNGQFYQNLQESGHQMKQEGQFQSQQEYSSYDPYVGCQPASEKYDFQNNEYGNNYEQQFWNRYKISDGETELCHTRMDGRKEADLTPKVEVAEQKQFSQDDSTKSLRTSIGGELQCTPISGDVFQQSIESRDSMISQCGNTSYQLLLEADGHVNFHGEHYKLSDEQTAHEKMRGGSFRNTTGSGMLIGYLNLPVSDCEAFPGDWICIFMALSYKIASSILKVIFMPPDRMIWGMFLSCLFVCLSVVNYNLRYNF